MADAVVKSVDPFSIAEDCGIEKGDTIVKVNNKEFTDVLDFRFLTSDEYYTVEVKKVDGSIEEKIEAVVKKVYGGNGIAILPAAKKQIESLTALGFSNCPVCIAKTQYSFSDDPAKLGAPENFTVTVKNVKVSAGAGFLVVLTGDIPTMPGLPKAPAAEKIDVDENGKITGLF